MLSAVLTLALAASVPAPAADVSEEELRKWRGLLECEWRIVSPYCQALEAFTAGSAPRMEESAIAGCTLVVLLPPKTPLWWEEVGALGLGPGRAAFGVVRPENDAERDQAIALIELLRSGGVAPPDQPLVSLVKNMKGRKDMGWPARVAGRSLVFSYSPNSTAGAGVVYLRQTTRGLVAIASLPDSFKIGVFRP